MLPKGRTVVCFIFSVLVLLMLHPAVWATGDPRCSTDQPYYNVGDTVTFSITVPDTGNYYLEIDLPDGSSVQLNLGTLDAGTYSFSIGQAGPPPGQRIVSLWGSIPPGSSYQQLASCGYGVQGPPTTTITCQYGGTYPNCNPPPPPRNSFCLTFTSQPISVEIHTSPSAQSGDCYTGGSVTLTADTQSAGYFFLAWIVDDRIISPSSWASSITVQMDTDHKVIAVYIDSSKMQSYAENMIPTDEFIQHQSRLPTMQGVVLKAQFNCRLPKASEII